MIISVCDREENILGKGENAGYKHFLLFPQCFENASFPGASKGVIVWECVNVIFISEIDRIVPTVSIFKQLPTALLKDLRECYKCMETNQVRPQENTVAFWKLTSSAFPMYHRL